MLPDVRSWAQGLPPDAGQGPPQGTPANPTTAAIYNSLVGLIDVLGLRGQAIPQALDLSDIKGVIDVEQGGWVQSIPNFLMVNVAAIPPTLANLTLVQPSTQPPILTQSMFAFSAQQVNNTGAATTAVQLELVLFNPVQGGSSDPGVPQSCVLSTFTVPGEPTGAAGALGPSVSWAAIAGTADAVFPVPPGFAVAVRSILGWPNLGLAIPVQGFVGNIPGRQRGR